MQIRFFEFCHQKFILLADALETGIKTSQKRKLTEIKHLENLINIKQEQLKKMKTELSANKPTKTEATSESLIDGNDDMFLTIFDGEEKMSEASKDSVLLEKKDVNEDENNE